MAVKFQVLSGGKPVRTSSMVDPRFLGGLIRVTETFIGEPVFELWFQHDLSNDLNQRIANYKLKLPESTLSGEPVSIFQTALNKYPLAPNEIIAVLNTDAYPFSILQKVAVNYDFLVGKQAPAVTVATAVQSGPLHCRKCGEENVYAVADGRGTNS